MIICAIDFESTGTDTAKDRITEIGAVWFEQTPLDKAIGDLKLLGSYSKLVYDVDYPPLSEEVQEVTGLSDQVLKEEGIPFDMAVFYMMAAFEKTGAYPDAFIAHNKAFDENIFKAEVERMWKKNLIPVMHRDFIVQIPWLCSIVDIQHPEKFRSKKLSHLALDYGCAVDPSVLHRAEDDCNLLVEMLSRANVDFSALLARSKVPDVIVRAIVPSPFGKGNDGGKGKDKAKACGYGWQRAPGTDGPEFKNCWVKKIKESELAAEKEKLGYEIAVIS